MAKKNKTLKELNLEFDILSERVKMLEEKSDTNKGSEANSKIEQIEDVLKSYDKQIEHLNRLLEKAESEKKTIIKRLKCKLSSVEFVMKFLSAKVI